MNKCKWEGLNFPAKKRKKNFKKNVTIAFNVLYAEKGKC